MMEEFERILDELLAGTTVEINLKITLKPAEPVEDDAKNSKPHRITCEKCGWTRAYMSKSSARRALRTHAQHCTGSTNNVEHGAWIRSMTYDK